MAASCSLCFPTLIHNNVDSAARRLRLPVEPLMTLHVLPLPHRTWTRMASARQWWMAMTWPTWRSVSRLCTAAARMLAANAARLHQRKKLTSAAAAPGKGPWPRPSDVEKALGVGEAAGVLYLYSTVVQNMIKVKTRCVI